jgi:hypothetical protein
MLIRDIQQLTDTPQFATTAVAGLLADEELLQAPYFLPFFPAGGSGGGLSLSKALGKVAIVPFSPIKASSIHPGTRLWDHQRKSNALS